MAVPYPQLTGVPDPAARDSLRLLWERVNQLSTQLANAGTASGLDLNGQPLAVVTPTASNQPLPVSQANADYISPANPPGLLADALNALLNGALQWLLSHALPHKTSATTYLRTTYYIGTLSPDTKPTLGAGDAGAIFWANDFDRAYNWTGSVWEDEPGQPERGTIAVSAAVSLAGALAASPGWALCDGSTVTGSTSTGGTTSVTTPNMQGGSTPYATPLLHNSLTTALSTAGGLSYTSGNNIGEFIVTPQSGLANSTVAASPHTHPLTITDTINGSGGIIDPGTSSPPPWPTLNVYVLYRL